MSRMALARFKLVLLLATTVECVDILSPHLVTVGENFTVICDALRFTGKMPAVDEAFTSINYLKILINLPALSDKFEALANYFTFSLPGLLEVKRIPDGKKWDVDFRGSANGGPNRDTMELVLRAHEAQCGDAGLYKCIMDYHMVLQGGTRTLEATEELKVKAAIEGLTLTADSASADTTQVLYYNVGVKVKLTCSLKGPDSLEIVWRREIKEPDHQNAATDTNAQFEKYPIQNDITQYQQELIPASACPTFKYHSELVFQMSETDTYRRYQCAILANHSEVAQRAVIVDLPKDTTESPQNSTKAPLDSQETIGRLVIIITIGVAVGLLICIIPCVFFYRWIKSKASKEKEVPQKSQDQTAGKTQIQITRTKDQNPQPADESEEFTSGVTSEESEISGSDVS